MGWDQHVDFSKQYGAGENDQEKSCGKANTLEQKCDAFRLDAAGKQNREKRAKGNKASGKKRKNKVLQY